MASPKRYYLKKENYTNFKTILTDLASYENNLAGSFDLIKAQFKASNKVEKVIREFYSP